MKKIGIVTLHGYSNYGNKLQNYALKRTLEKLEFDVNTLVIQKEDNFYVKLSNFLKKSIIKYRSIGVNKAYEIENSNREEVFKSFSESYLNELFIKVFNKNNKQKLEQFSYVVVGSDQVWHPAQYFNLDIYFLDFIEPSKRISYSPSIAVENLPEKYEKKYRKYLKQMSSISIREDAGAEIINKLIGKEPPVLVDPTMLLNKEEWLMIAKPAINRPSNPYLLTYFLGGPTDETREKLEKLADKENMTIINLGDITEKETYETGPSEFLDYINNASAFFTDSFHGVVFSIIFQTPFIVYERLSSGPSMYSRIETILDNFDMRNREANRFNQDIFSMDFSGTHEVLDREYNKSIKYLKMALKIEE